MDTILGDLWLIWVTGKRIGPIDYVIVAKTASLVKMKLGVHMTLTKSIFHVHSF